MGEESPKQLYVLVVDDIDDIAMSTAVLLGTCGYRAEIALTAHDALKLALDDPPDVVLLDIGLPHMDGWKVAQKIRANTTGKQPAIIAVSGYGTESDRLRSADEGLDGHLLKPVDPEALIDLLEKMQRDLGNTEKRIAASVKATGS